MDGWRTFDAAPDGKPIGEKAARIAGDKTDPVRKTPGRRSARPATYEKWTREQLYAHAREMGIDRRSSMNKQQLVEALRARQE